MSATDSLLVVIDLQARLMPAISGGHEAVAAAGRLIDGARALGVPVMATEQYPQGLGATIAGQSGETVRDRAEKV
ncbi:isochorismatase family protein [Tistrella bauzanensis]